MIRIASILYGLFAAGAVLWCWLAGRLPWPLYDPGRVTLPRLALSVGGGLALGLAVVALTRLTAHLRWVRGLVHWFREVLGRLSWGQVLALALLSATGEELLFRGAMQPAWGIVPTTLVFALLHLPPRFALCAWTVMAGLLGLAFGYLTRWTGTIAGAVVAHVVINALNLRHITHEQTHLEQAPIVAGNLPAPDPPPSMGDHEQPSHLCPNAVPGPGPEPGPRQ